MNDSKIVDESEIVFVVADIDNTACPVCGQPVTGYDMNRPMRQKVTPVEMWPGGPIWNDPGKQVIMEPDGPAIITVTPCDHRVDSVVFTEEAAEQWKATHG